jgi:hypothetical protein
VNCKFGINWNKKKDIVFQMGIGPENAGVGTLMRTKISEECDSGGVTMMATPIEEEN